MTHPSKRKGNRYERELVDEAKERGLSAQRAYASDGRSLGESEEVDVMIDSVRVQAKKRKNIANYLTVPEGADVTIIRENYGDSLVLLPLESFFQLVESVDSFPTGEEK